MINYKIIFLALFSWMFTKHIVQAANSYAAEKSVGSSFLYQSVAARTSSKGTKTIIRLNPQGKAFVSVVAFSASVGILLTGAGIYDGIRTEGWTKDTLF